MATGCYVTRYFPASFKGVPFEAMELSSEHGRRGAEGEFVFSEQTGYVDMGRKIRRYSVSARFPTNDHLSASQALVSACESYGPGTLVHPTWGAIQVGCTSIKVTDNPIEQIGYTTAEMTFVEAASLGLGFSIGASLFGFDFTDSLAAIRGSFLENYNPVKSLIRNIEGVVSTVSSVIGVLKTEYAKTVGVAGTIAQYQTLSNFDDVIVDTTSLKVASTAYDALYASFLAVTNNSTGEEKYQSLRNVANFAAKSSSLSGVAKTSQDTVYATTRLIAVTFMCNAAVEKKPTTLQAALLQYDQIMTIIDGEIAVSIANCDGVLHASLRNLAANVKPALLNRAYNLPTLITYDLKKGSHSLVAAYELFGDAKRFAEIEVRNPYSSPFANQRSLTATNG